MASSVGRKLAKSEFRNFDSHESIASKRAIRSGRACVCMYNDQRKKRH